MGPGCSARDNRVSGAVRQGSILPLLLHLGPWSWQIVLLQSTSIVQTGWVELAGAVGTLEVDPDMPVQVGLVTGAILAHWTHEWLLPGVDLEMPVQQSLADEALAAAWPCAGVALTVDLLGVRPHVRLPEECDTAAEVRRGQPFVHGHHVSLEVVPPVGLILTLGVATAKWFVILLSI